VRRDQLVEMRKAERVRLKTVRDEVVIDSLTAIVALLNDQIKVLKDHAGSGGNRPCRPESRPILDHAARLMLAFVTRSGDKDRTMRVTLPGARPCV